jgi:hypothetical protein
MIKGLFKLPKHWSTFVFVFMSVWVLVEQVRLSRRTMILTEKTDSLRIETRRLQELREKENNAIQL